MLRKPAPKRHEIPAFLDTPGGIITVAGVRFSTTQALLEDYAGDVLEKVSLGVLIERAELWLRSAQTLTVWVLALLLLLTPPLWAGALGLIVYVVWQILMPALVNRRLAAALRVAEKPIMQAALYVAVLSVLGIRGELGAVGVGLVGFIGFRWQLIPLLVRPLVRAAHRRLFTLPPADQVLRGFVQLAAIRHGVSLPQVDELRGRMPWSRGS